MNLDLPELQQGLLIYLLLIVSLTFHEWGHAAMADKLGDDTPRSQGRVTLNPLAHIDLIGTVLIPLMGILGFFGGFAMIGWAKPVMIDPGNLRGKHDRSWVTIAGPAMNLILALVATLVSVFLGHLDPKFDALCWLFIQINVLLMLFNLMPVPPLDGSKFLMYWGGMKEETYANFARFGGLILIVLLNIPGFGRLLGTVAGYVLMAFALIHGLLS